MPIPNSNPLALNKMHEDRVYYQIILDKFNKELYECGVILLTQLHARSLHCSHIEIKLITLDPARMAIHIK